MLNVNMGVATFTETLQDHIRFLRGFQRIDKRKFPAGEIIFLNINYEKSCFHRMKYSRSRLKTESTSPDVAFAEQRLETLTPYTLSLSNASNYIIRCRLRPFCCCLLNKILCDRSRYRNTLVAADDHGIDANHLTLGIDQRPAGVAGGKRG